MMPTQATQGHENPEPNNLDRLHAASDDPGGSKDQQPGPDGKKPGDKAAPGAGPSRGLFGFVMILIVGVLLVMFFSSATGGNKITIGEFVAHYKADDIDKSSVVLRENALTAKLVQSDVSPKPITVKVPVNTANKELIAAQVDEITGGNYTALPASGLTQFLLFFGPIILFILVIWFFISRGLRNAGGGAGMLGNFGKSKHRTMTKEMTGVTFKDVAGID